MLRRRPVNPSSRLEETHLRKRHIPVCSKATAPPSLVCVRLSSHLINGQFAPARSKRDKGSKEQPLGLTLEVRPRFTRVLPVEGNGADIFDIESILQLDVQVVPDKLWYGSNISFEPAAGRQRGGGPGYRSSTFLWSNALVGRIGENTYFGPEVRYLRGYEGTFLNQLESEALTVGPALHHRFTEKIWLTVAYAGQVWGRDTDPTLVGRALGLNQFERHNVRVKFGMEF